MVTKERSPIGVIKPEGLGIDMIIVAVGYRLNVFGFLAGKGLDGNYGFWDQRLATEFMYKHGKAFGGNPNNITISGLSAGAFSVQMQLNYEVFERPGSCASEYPLFKRVIMLSNALPSTPKSLEEANVQLELLYDQLEIPKDERSIETLCKVPTKKLFDASRALRVNTYRAVVDNKFIGKDILTHAYNGDLGKEMKERGISIIIGEVEHEEALYKLHESPANAADLLPALVNYYREEVCNKILKEYPTPKDEDSYDKLQDLYGQITSEMQVRASIRRFVQGLYNGGLPLDMLHRYRINFDAQIFLDKRIEPMKNQIPHGADLTIWLYAGYGEVTKAEHDAIKEWMKPVENFIKGEKVDWGTKSIDEYRYMDRDGSIKVVRDSYFDRLINLANIAAGVV